MIVKGDIGPLPKHKGERHYDDTIRNDGKCELLPVFTQFIGTNVFQVVHKILVSYSPDFFGYTCVILTYIAITLELINKR